ncbi:hypothetical protein [Streptomyces roseochromogenus]|uniref:Uncharacterized protein n=1 Tax=Streptomyces roseochromogenus subsp. oscitans DS 12.976 TaxID=1352936 RepID=V6KQP5_STRRC|nr:hypothetical protein [Streptomyces roseochromogenus]EST33746.1 hypothetical protein M878_11920 [Streptomyces roseochromogenus subsp. oscitans DS 12.976]
MTRTSTLADEVCAALADSGFRLAASLEEREGEAGVYVEQDWVGDGALVLWNGQDPDEGGNAQARPDGRQLSQVVYRALAEVLMARGFEVTHHPGTELHPPQLTVVGRRG